MKWDSGFDGPEFHDALNEELGKFREGQIIDVKFSEYAYRHEAEEETKWGYSAYILYREIEK